MTDTDVSRRLFLKQSAALGASNWAKIVLPSLAALSQAACGAKEEQAQFKVLTADEGRELEAITARILPTTDTPGAREAGVVYFFDTTFGTFNAPMLSPVRGMLQQFQRGIEGGVPFSSLSEDDQDAYLATQEQTPFFGMVKFLTMCGFFGMSKYGGNRDNIGWDLLGVNLETHVYTSPFGFYDAEYLKEHPDA